MQNLAIPFLHIPSSASFFSKQTGQIPTALPSHPYPNLAPHYTSPFNTCAYFRRLHFIPVYFQIVGMARPWLTFSMFFSLQNMKKININGKAVSSLKLLNEFHSNLVLRVHVKRFDCNQSTVTPILQKDQLKLCQFSQKWPITTWHKIYISLKSAVSTLFYDVTI
jgi:hypothetical protein